VTTGRIKAIKSRIRSVMNTEMTTKDELFTLALQRHQAGDLQQAEHGYREILQFDPGFADAHHLLGVLACQKGQYDQAVAAIGHAVGLVPKAGVYHANLGVAYESSGRLDEAAASYQKAIELRPEDADAHYNLGNVLRRQSKFADAVCHYQEALRLQPVYPQAHCNLGLALASQGKLKEAVAQYEQGLRLSPNSAELYNNMGAALTELERLGDAVACFRKALQIAPNFVQAHHSLGCAFQRQNNLEEAILCYRQAVRLSPSYAEAHNNLGYVLERQNKFEEATRSYEQALLIDPNYAEAFNNLGNALDRQDQLDEAVSCYQKALALKPHCAETHNDFATVRMRQGLFSEAAAGYERALHLKPNFPAARLNRSLLRLLLGDLEQGWPDFDWRQPRPGFVIRRFSQPLWDGADLTGLTILIYAEQGFGDTIQFIRFVQQVKDRGGRVIVECQPQMLQLLASVQGIDSLVAEGGQLPHFDVQAPLLSLPGILGTSLATIPNAVPYLQTDQALVKRWQQELEMSDIRHPTSDVKKADIGHCNAVTGRVFRVGIAWQGNTSYRYDGQRSIPFKHFAPLGRVEGAQLISLQKGFGTEQLDSFAGQCPCLDLGCRLDQGTGAFVETAAVMANLDLVICSDTALAHLAGALGVPVWVAVNKVPDWRWLLEREDSPWYPTMRLFRQTNRGCWDEVFERIAEELSQITRHGSCAKKTTITGDQ
jgi:tetratricopeptide (TPR) repeat protein